MPRRKKKSRKSPKYFEYRKTIESDGFNFVAIFLGMTTSSIVLLLLWSQLVSLSSKAQVIEAVGKKGFEVQLEKMNDKTFEELLSLSDVNKLTAILDTLSRMPIAADPKQEVRRHTRRIDTANSLMILPLSLSQQRRAVSAKIDALSQAYYLNVVHDLNQPSLGENLKTASDEYETNSDKDISRDARIARIKYEALEMVNAEFGATTVPLSKLTIELLEDFPTDEKVHEQIKELVNYFLFDFDNQVGVKFIESILASRDRLAPASQFLEELDDYSVLSEYESLFVNRLIQGPAGQQKLFDRSLELVADPQAKQPRLKKVDRVAQWFEQDQQWDRARQIYEKLGQSNQNYQDDRAATLAKLLVNQATQRIKLIDQPFELSGMTLDDQTLDSKRLSGRVCVLFFWSLKNSQSIQELQKFDKLASAWSKDQVALLAVNNDPQSDEQPDPSKLSLNNIASLDFSTNQKVVEMCPSLITPRAIIVGKDGRLKHLNVPMINLETEIELNLIK